MHRRPRLQGWLMAVAWLACLGAVGASSGCKMRGHSRAPKPAPAVASHANAPLHVVAAGDTLSRIAAAWRVSVDSIITANQLAAIDLVPGQRLRIPGGVRPAPETVAPVAPEAAKFYLGRNSWAVEPIDLGNVIPMGVKPYRITIHHSSDDIDASGEPKSTLRHIERLHKMGVGKNEPFACIGYHFVISADGRVWEGRPLAYQGAHSTGDNNRGNIGVCLLGNFERHRVPAIQRDALVGLLDRLCAEHRIAPSHDTILGHRHFKPTDCPGRFLTPVVTAYASGRR